MFLSYYNRRNGPPILPNEGSHQWVDRERRDRQVSGQKEPRSGHRQPRPNRNRAVVGRLVIAKPLDGGRYAEQDDDDGDEVEAEKVDGASQRDQAQHLEPL